MTTLQPWNSSPNWDALARNPYRAPGQFTTETEIDKRPRHIDPTGIQLPLIPHSTNQSSPDPQPSGRRFYKLPPIGVVLEEPDEETERGDVTGLAELAAQALQAQQAQQAQQVQKTTRYSNAREVSEVITIPSDDEADQESSTTGTSTKNNAHKTSINISHFITSTIDVDDNTVYILVEWKHGHTKQTWELETDLQALDYQRLYEFWDTKGGRYAATGLRRDRVFRILGHREEEGLYRVHWAGLPRREGTWETLEDLVTIYRVGYMLDDYLHGKT